MHRIVLKHVLLWFVVKQQSLFSHRNRNTCEFTWTASRVIRVNGNGRAIVLKPLVLHSQEQRPPAAPYRVLYSKWIDCTFPHRLCPEVVPASRRCSRAQQANYSRWEGDVYTETNTPFTAYKLSLCLSGIDWFNSGSQLVYGLVFSVDLEDEGIRHICSCCIYLYLYEIQPRASWTWVWLNTWLFISTASMFSPGFVHLLGLFIGQTLQ